MSRVWIGADPGLQGSVSFIPERGDPWCVKMPESMRDLLDALIDGAADKVAVAQVELVHSSPQMGVKSAFTFGQGFGKLEMAFTAAKIPFSYVRPTAWQKAIGCMSKGDKNVTKSAAQRLFPTMKIYHWNADSLLIAEYCRRTNV